MVVTIMTGTTLGTGKVGGESLVYRHRTRDFTGDEGDDDGDCDSDDDNDVRLTIITMVMSRRRR